MEGSVVGVRGFLKGKRFTLGTESITFGRSEENDVVLPSETVSRVHAELRREGDAFVLTDRGSSNGTWVNDTRQTTCNLQAGDYISMGDEVFRFDTSDGERTEPAPPTVGAPADVLRVIVTGGGPVGLSFALLLQDLIGPRVDITVYDGRWTRAGGQVVWKRPDEGNIRRQQVVTIQSRQYLRLPLEVQERLFTPGNYSEMWPKGPDSIDDFGPRNVRIAYVEDQLLAIANDKPDHIQLVPETFDPAAARDDVMTRHVLAICEGSRSRTLKYFADRFGAGDPSIRQNTEQLKPFLHSLPQGRTLHKRWQEDRVMASTMEFAVFL